jgi:hypothetical protein
MTEGMVRIDKIDQGLPQVPEKVRQELKVYCENLCKTFQEKLVSITIVGSAVTAEFSPDISDINLLCVLSEMELRDLDPAIDQVQKWWRKRGFSPRFLSRQNLISSAQYLPVDFWTLRQQRWVVFGEDILDTLDLRHEDLLWHLRHELKGLRMRLKQQYWRVCREVRPARCHLLTAYTTIHHLVKVMDFLKGHPGEQIPNPFFEQFKTGSGPAGRFLETMALVRQGKAKIRKGDIGALFNGLMDIVRELDRTVGEIVP